MARSKRKEEARDDRKKGDSRADEEARDDKRKAKHHSGHKHHGTVNEKLKALSHQSGHESLGAAPGGYPKDPANAEAVFTTGPGQAVEYNYKRMGTYSEDYALQQSQQQAEVPPIAGFGQVLTTQSSGGTQAVKSGAANNPT